MKRLKWVLGLSIVGTLAVSGAALALSSGSLLAPTPSLMQSVTAKALQTRSSYGMMGGNTVANGETKYQGYGMMGGNGSRGYGMMGGNGSQGSGMMGGGYDAASLGIKLPNGQVTTDDQVLAIANAYVQVLGQNLKIDEIHEFSDAYEVELSEVTTDTKAFEFIINKNSGYITSEMGPNTMWNNKYGHMGIGSGTNPTVSAEQASQTAQNFVKGQFGTGYSVEQPETAPGYFEFMVLKDNKDYAELDVNAYTGQAWFENWHGPIIKTIETQNSTK